MCIIIALGFSLTALVTYCSNSAIFQRNREYISRLTSRGLYHQIDSLFSEPIDVSLTMSNDIFLKKLLEEEPDWENKKFIKNIQDYLNTYKEQYEYTSFFLISTETNYCYHSDTGLDHIMSGKNPHDQWYYSSLKDSAKYSLNVDNAPAASANDKITVYINCKIYSPENRVIGIVGVGLHIALLQDMLKSYEESFQVQSYLVNAEGTMEISSHPNSDFKGDLFEKSVFKEYKADILSNMKTTGIFPYTSHNSSGILVSRYIPSLNWHLIIDNDTFSLDIQLARQAIVCVVIIIMVTAIVLLVITKLICKYNSLIILLTEEQQKKHQLVFQTETEKLYENILEIDLTHNCVANEATQNYLAQLGIPADTPFDTALYMIAKRTVKEDYRETYIKTLSPESILEAYTEGKTRLQFDVQSSNDKGHSYYWMRITACIFYWEENQSVRMFCYHQNINRQKQRELLISEKMRRDCLSGVYNKAATQDLIREQLAASPEGLFAFFILDIDCFKKVNDTYGHAFGDLVIADFAQKLNQQFRKDDIVGRIGGDEFVVFLSVPSREWVYAKAKAVSGAMRYTFSKGQNFCPVSASIGVALAPDSGRNFEALYKNSDEALYYTKRNHKSGYTIYTTKMSVKTNE